MLPRAASPTIFAALWLALAAVGCAQPPVGPQICARPNTAEPERFEQGTVGDGVYMTAPWDGEYLLFEGGDWYRVEHGLGCRPAVIQPYLAFEKYPHGEVELSLIENDSVAPGVGNQAEIKEVTDESFVILNGSCVDYYLRVVAFGCEPGSEGSGAGGAGGTAMGAGGSSVDAGGAGGA